MYGGEGEIRTHGNLAATLDFESSALDHSATSPCFLADRNGNSFTRPDSFHFSSSCYSFCYMANFETLKGLCMDERGGPMPKPDCRAAIINHLILEEMMDIDEAEDLAEKTLNDTGFWPKQPEEKEEIISEEPSSDLP